MVYSVVCNYSKEGCLKRFLALVLFDLVNKVFVNLETICLIKNIIFISTEVGLDAVSYAHAETTHTQINYTCPKFLKSDWLLEFST